jgi:hypothetical protein
MAEKKKYLLRVDPELYAALEGWAADEIRSVNAQIEFLLVECVRKSGRLRKWPALDDSGQEGQP